MNTPNKYIEILKEIKLRTEVIDAFLAKQASAVYLPTTAESIILQVRKILELIAFSSLVANNELYSATHTAFSKHWNARLILNDIERLNSSFYPSPIIQIPSKKPGYHMEWLARKNDFLSKENFLEIYEKCGSILHSENPFGAKINFNKCIDDAVIWRNRIVNLLSAHTIRLVDDTNLYLFQMGEIGRDPSYTPFGLVEDAN